MILKTGFTSDSMASVPLEEGKLDSSIKPGTSLPLSFIFCACGCKIGCKIDNEDDDKLTEKKKKKKIP